MPPPLCLEAGGAGALYELECRERIGLRHVGCDRSVSKGSPRGLAGRVATSHHAGICGTGNPKAQFPPKRHGCEVITRSNGLPCTPTMARIMADPERDSQAIRQALVRRTIERFDAGDREIRVDEVDPECEVRSAMTGSVYRGYDGVRAWMREIDEQFDAWRVRIDELAPVTGARLLALGSIQFRGRGSGIELKVPVAWLFEFRDDRVLRMTTFATHDDARRAAGLG